MAIQKKMQNDFEERLLKTIKENQESYIYAYWDDPDYNLHEHGTNSKKINKVLKNINNFVT